MCINEGILTSLSDFNRFCEIILFERFESNPSHDVFLDFVHDPNDADILQDAVDIEADILLTRNLKDFKIDMIFSTF